MLGTIFLVLLVLMLALPTWPHSDNSWGYAKSGALGTVLLVAVVLLVFGRI